MSDHDNHDEEPDPDCANCEQEMRQEMAYWHGQWQAEAPIRESVALARADIGSSETGELTQDEMADVQRRLK
jgi:hypothetical protein